MAPITNTVGFHDLSSASLRSAVSLDVHFISSLPVRQVHAYRAWVDSKPVQMVWGVD